MLQIKANPINNSTAEIVFFEINDSSPLSNLLYISPHKIPNPKSNNMGLIKNLSSVFDGFKKIPVVPSINIINVSSV